MFSKFVKSILIKSSWYKGRIINGKDYLKKYVLEEDASNSIFQKVIDFVSEFGGLLVEYPSISKSNSPNFLKLDFRLEKLLCYINDEHVQRIGKKVCFIGTSENGYNTLLMDEDGKVYISNDTEFDLIKIGDSGYDAIERICTHNEKREFILNEKVDDNKEFQKQLKKLTDDILLKYNKQQLDFTREQ